MANKVSDGVSYGLMYHTPEGISRTLAGLEVLAESLPGLVHAANGPSLTGNPMRALRYLDDAKDMLVEYRRHRREEEGEREKRSAIAKEEHFSACVAKATADGIRIGIEQEQQRQKEAHRGRKH